MQVAEQFALHNETYAIAVNFVDRFMSAVPKVTTDQLQLIAITCLFVASKMEEYSPISASDLATAAEGAYNVETIQKTEQFLTQKLGWNLVPPTACAWLKLFLISACKRENTQLISTLGIPFPKAQFVRLVHVLDFCTLDITSLNFLPSVVAASIFSRHFNRINKTKLSDVQLEEITGYSLSELAECIEWLCFFDDIPLTKLCRTPSEFLPPDVHERQHSSQEALSFIKKKLRADTNATRRCSQ